MSTDPLNRRRFLTIGSAGVASVLLGCSKTGDVKGHTGDTVGTGDSTADTDTDTDTDTDDSCEATTSDITGPYWRDGIPVRNDFDLYGHEGHTLLLSGQVRDEDCQPIPNAVIEMWHAMPTLIAAEDLEPSDTVDYDTDSEGYRYYGQFATDSDGTYSMKTLKPGWYLNGSAFRPSHIHVKVYVDGVEKLTTQLYFKEDPFITNDPWASEAPERAVELAAKEDGTLEGRFDFTV